MMTEERLVQVQQCCSSGATHASVGDYSQYWNEELNWWECTCPAYTYSKAMLKRQNRLVKPPCKHILKELQSRCYWNEIVGQKQTDEQQEKMICPNCGGRTEWVTVVLS